MQKLTSWIVAFSLGFLSLPFAQADTLANIKTKGVLVAGVKDSLPPFGYVDAQTRSIVGYDVDFVRAIADKLGVKLELKPVTSANRIPQLTSGNIDIIAATMTKNPERAQQIDFSYAYFLTGQKFIVPKGKLRSLNDLAGKRIATAKGSTSEQNVKRAVPSATVLAFDDYPQAFLALRQKRVAAITTDEAILAGILAKAPDKTAYEIPALRIADEPYGLGMRRGDTAWVAFVNQTLLDMEKSGDAKRIFDKWFGPKSEAPIKRDFVISNAH